MKMLIVSFSALLLFLSTAELSAEAEAQAPKALVMKTAEVSGFVVSLIELRESAHHRKFEGDELKIIAEVLAKAKFTKKTNPWDLARTTNISRFLFQFGFLVGTPRSGQIESGMFTIDCKTLYLRESMFKLDAESAEKLRTLFPPTRNKLTISELPEIPEKDRPVEQDVAPKSDRAGELED